MKQNLNPWLLRKCASRGAQASSGPRAPRTLWGLRYCGLWVLFLVGFAGCQAERRKSDAELGLTPPQAVGRHIFERQCNGCHHAYSPAPRKGPSLQGLFKRPYMKNGMPVNDERVQELITIGHGKMPAFGRALSQEQIQRVMQYLHTL